MSRPLLAAALLLAMSAAVCAQNAASGFVPPETEQKLAQITGATHAAYQAGAGQAKPGCASALAEQNAIAELKKQLKPGFKADVRYMLVPLVSGATLAADGYQFLYYSSAFDVGYGPEEVIGSMRLNAFCAPLGEVGGRGQLSAAVIKY